MPMAGARRNETIKRVIKRGKSRAIKPRDLYSHQPTTRTHNQHYSSSRELLFLPMRLQLPSATVHSMTSNWMTRISMHLPPTKGASRQDEVIPNPVWWKKASHTGVWLGRRPKESNTCSGGNLIYGGRGARERSTFWRRRLLLLRLIRAALFLSKNTVACFHLVMGRKKNETDQGDGAENSDLVVINNLRQ